MQMNKYVNSVSNLFVNNRLLKFAVVILAGMQLMNYVTMKELQEQQKTVIVPVGITERVEVGMSSADESYLNAMAVYVTTLLYSTTPISAETQYKILLKLFTPEAYAKYSELLLLNASSQAKNQITQTMKIETIAFQTEPEREIRLELASDRYIFKDKVDDGKRIKLKIGYTFERGTFKITYLEELRQ